MNYAYVYNSAIVRIDTFTDELPVHKLAGRTDLLPVVDVIPDYDTNTQYLSDEFHIIETDRVIRTWNVVDLPEKRTSIEERVVMIEKENRALKEVLFEKLVLSKNEIDNKIEFIAIASAAVNQSIEEKTNG